jgi:hypothetical protein
MGHTLCLSGKTFVVSGQLESLTRPQAEDLVKRHGGRTTGQVSGETTFLIAGQNSGTRKVATVRWRGLCIVLTTMLDNPPSAWFCQRLAHPWLLLMEACASWVTVTSGHCAC